MGKLHLSRKKFMFGFILSMMEQRSVQFPLLGEKLNAGCKTASNVRRIQAFFEDYALDYPGFAVLWLSLIAKQKLTICIDRTNWKFGKQNINILCLTAYYQGIGLPIFFELLDKKGNSKQTERIDLVQKFIDLFGKERIGKIVGDREFIGVQWLSWLQSEGIAFVMRIPKHHLVRYNGLSLRAREHLGDKSFGFYEKVWLDGICTNLLIEDLGAGEYLILAGDTNKNSLSDTYRKRWSIETFFQAIKKRGFNLEETHLQDLTKLKKLIALVMTSFLFCVQIGLWQDQNRQAINIQKNGYKAYSFFRYGLNVWRNISAFIESRYEKLSDLFEILHQIILKNFAQKLL